MPGCYVVFPYPKDSAHPHDIAFQLVQDVTNVPREQSDLKSAVDRTLDVIRGMLSPNDAKFRQYFDELLSLAQYGLAGVTAQPLQAMETLQILQNRILDREKGRAIGRYMKILLYALSVPTALALIVSAGMAWAVWAHAVPYAALNLLLIYPGLIFGLLFSAFMRCRSISFFELHVIETDRFPAWMKALFAIITVVIAGAFLKAGLFEIKIGKFPLSEFDVNPLSAFIFGLVVGIAQEIITARIESVKGSVSAKS